MSRKRTAYEMVAKARADARKADEKTDIHLTEERNRVLDEFGRLFGERLPLFVPCHCRSKKPILKWSKLTQDNLPDWYDGLLKQQFDMGGNIAVKLGAASHNLVAIDFDNDDLVPTFIRANPRLAETLCTRGSKGCQIWFFAAGSYPPEVRRIEVNGKSEGTGEWRGGKGLSMLWGVHPSGVPYRRINDVPPIDFAFGDIIWPAGWTLTELTRAQTREPGERTQIKGPIDFERLDDFLESNDAGIIDVLVEEYFPGAKDDGKMWHCADISGRAPRNEGSFTISQNGWCRDWDGSYSPTSIINAITSQSRADITGEKKITYGEVIAFLKKEIGEDFKTASEPESTIMDRVKKIAEQGKGAETEEDKAQRDLDFIRTRFAYATCSDEFYFYHGDDVWGAIGDTRVGLILTQDLRIKAEDIGSCERFIMKECPVRIGVNVAGYSAGIHTDTAGKPFLVLETTKLPELIKGDWSLINNILHGLLGTPDDLTRLGLEKLGLDQVGLFHCWMKWGMEALRDRSRAPGHYLIIMGPPKCGKTLLQEKIISPLLGCGPTDATPYLTRSAGSSDFNSDLLGSFHWMISDGLAFKNYQNRKSYTENVKRVIANSEQRLHAKYKNAGMVPFCCRLSGTLNPSAVESLPLLEEGMTDKLLVFVGKQHQHLPSREKPRTEFEAQIRTELPAYAHFLMNEGRYRTPSKRLTASALDFTAG
jgi:hypothetical protein